jgi:hypothetical protein
MKEEAPMSKDPIRGKTLRFTFDDGPMAEKTFEHSFRVDGTVTFRMVTAGVSGKPSEAKGDDATATKYEMAAVGDDLWAVSYLSRQGYTLTTVLDFNTKKLVAFSSNEKMLGMQHGHVQEVGQSARNVADAPAPRH